MQYSETESTGWKKTERGWVAFDEECVELCEIDTWLFMCGHAEVTETPVGYPFQPPDTNGPCRHCGREEPDGECDDPFAD